MKMWGIVKEAAIDALDTYMEGKEEPCIVDLLTFNRQHKVNLLVG